MTGSSSTPETAAANERLDALLSVIASVVADASWNHDDRYDVTAQRIVDDLAAAGFTVVSGGEGLQHGDRLERSGALDSSGRHVRPSSLAYPPHPCIPVWRLASGAAPGTTAEDAQQAALDIAQRYEHEDDTRIGVLSREVLRLHRAAGTTAPETTPAALTDNERHLVTCYAQNFGQRCEHPAHARGGSGVAETTP